jgi:hypothetical protein
VILVPLTRRAGGRDLCDRLVQVAVHVLVMMTTTVEPDLSTESARVYLNREPEDVPPHPGNGWTRFVCVSDTHSRSVPTPAGDVLLHSGDIGHGRVEDIKSMFAWLKTLPHEKKV